MSTQGGVSKKLAGGEPRNLPQSNSTNHLTSIQPYNPGSTQGNMPSYSSSVAASRIFPASIDSLPQFKQLLGMSLAKFSDALTLK